MSSLRLTEDPVPLAASMSSAVSRSAMLCSRRVLALLTNQRSASVVPRGGLLAVANAGGVQGAADDLVPNAREVLRAAASHEHDRVLLQVVADAGDVCGDLDARGQTDARDLPERRVGLLRGGRVDARADAAALRRALER